MEASLLNVVVMIATGAAVIKFAIFEWEGVARTWRRVQRRKGGARVSRKPARAKQICR